MTKHTAIFIPSTYLRGENDETLIVAMARPHAIAGDEIEVMPAGWAKDGVDNLRAGRVGGIADDAVDDKAQRRAAKRDDRNSIAGREIFEIPENSRVAANAIDMTGNDGIAVLPRSRAEVIPEDAAPVRRVDGFGDRRVHDAGRGFADEDDRSIDMNGGNLQARRLPRLAGYRVRGNISRRGRVAGDVICHDSDHQQRDQTTVEQELFHEPP